MFSAIFSTFAERDIPGLGATYKEPVTRKDGDAGMSNKPLKLSPKGRQLPEPPRKEMTKVQTLTKRPAASNWKNLLVKVGLLMGLAAVSIAYVAGLGEETAAVVAQKRELPIYSVERQDQSISISFDASWGADKTIALLDILDKYNVKTTFFLVGGWVDKYPDMVKEIFARGHEIGNHSDSHPHMSQQSEQQIRDELRIMSDKVETLTGVRPTLFRPPYGDYNNRVISVSRAEGYEAVQWSIDSLDWKDRGTEDIIRQCTRKVEAGDIVLFHNDSNDILNALPTVIQHYQGLGFDIIPVSQLLLEGDYTIDVQGKQHPVNEPTQDQ